MGHLDGTRWHSLFSFVLQALSIQVPAAGGEICEGKGGGLLTYVSERLNRRVLVLICGGEPPKDLSFGAMNRGSLPGLASAL